MTDTVAPEEFIEFVTQPERRADPYAFYERLRTLDPVHRVPLGVWLLTRYDDVALVLRDPRFSSDEHHVTNYNDSGMVGAFGRMFNAMLLFKDDPHHKRLRDLVQKAFTRKMVENLRPRIAEIVDRLIDDMLAKGNADLIADFAYPLPVVVICELLGVPLADQSGFHEWAPDLAGRFEVQPLRTAEDEERGERATERLIEYLDGLIERKRHDPDDALLSSLVRVEDDGDRLTHDELLATCMLLLFAGHETTANLIGNGVFSLMTNRDQWDRLVTDPTLARSAVEELLRFDSPVQLVQRITLDDVTIGDQHLPKGEAIAVMLGAANRDPSKFAEPDSLDLTREGAPLIAFGGGMHFCLGAPLARLEAQNAFASLAARVPGLVLDGEPERRPSLLIRGFRSLPVSVS